MRIHTDTLTYDNISKATSGLPGVHVSVQEHRSRTHARAFEVRLTGNGGTPNHSPTNYAGPMAATWDEWGVVIGRLYLIDPGMMVGNASSPIYHDAEHFHWSTGNRFAGVYSGTMSRLNINLPADTHKRHRWEYVGRCVTGAYHVHKCKGSKGNPCSAIRRFMAHRRDWSEISGAEYVTHQLVGG